VVKSLLVGLVVGTAIGIFVRLRARADAFESPPARPRVDEPAARADTADDAELDRLTRPELYRRAAALGIRGRSEMTKAELVAALRARRGGGS
jgi:Rho termination factor, N-terminal domain